MKNWLCLLPAVLIMAVPLAAAPPMSTPTVREAPPAPAAPRPVILPTPVERRLTNGLRVVVVPRRGSGLLSVVLAVKGAGGASDPPDKAGLASLAASLLTRGTQTRSATEIARTIESLGGTLGAGAGWDSASISLSVLRTNREPAFALLADVVQHPAFQPDEVARLRTENLDDLRVSLEEPGTIARAAAARVVFGNAPYGHLIGGTPQSVPRLSRADVVAFQQTHFAPAASVLVFGGDISPDEAFTLAEKEFGGWQAGKTAGAAKRLLVSPPVRVTLPPLTGSIVVIDKPDAEQAAVIVTRKALARRDSDYYAAQVANDVLGGGYSSRLYYEVRVRRGLAYGAGSGVAARREIGPFIASAQTKNESAAEVAQVIRDQIKRLADAPPSEADLKTHRAALSGEYARALESGGGLTSQAATLAALDVPLADLAGYLPALQRVHEADVRRVASSHLSVGGASVIIVGDGRRFLPDLRRRFKGTAISVIPIARLNLNRADLQKR